VVLLLEALEQVNIAGFCKHARHGGEGGQCGGIHKHVEGGTHDRKGGP